MTLSHGTIQNFNLSKALCKAETIRKEKIYDFIFRSKFVQVSFDFEAFSIPIFAGGNEATKAGRKNEKKKLRN